ncbi:cytosolic phospholipase A2 gamma isoform X2 [Sphaeramia orbicularis]|nr:cytosolic phospholipase A2 gamma isoform X2 [Sphaeramia orbicularis]XP_029997429.1 cytosolic phospholipase A2 gamma isoform X2 [Sphaeramia orbicularis]XP_029997431.1 cytosolic phospholipase A2 gamma isoform X2 [Sphaeramia orbicularis]
MEGKSTTLERPIRQSQTLCAGEQEYIHQRKQVVLESLNRLGINCTVDLVPHIALLASGGGQRAAVGLVGSLHQMEKDGLLDAVLYLGGVSGSTWSMAPLYSDPEWSVNMDRAVSILSGPGVQLEDALAWLGRTAQEDNFSLTDIWGVMTAAGIMKQMDLRRLSDEAGRNATNPYPIYCAIEKYCFSNGPTEGKWFEVSPHEAGFTELGLFVETSLLGSKFHNGTMLEKKPEMDMVRLQGILGCALADEEIAQEYIPPWIFAPGYMDSGAEEYLRAYIVLDKFVALTRSTITDPAALADLDGLQKILQDKVNHNVSALLESKSPEERKQFFAQRTMELLNAVEMWSQSLQDGPFKTHVSLLTKQIIPLIVKWEWGTTRNFLYQYEDSIIPPCLHSSESFHLMDAGLLINVAYPSFLGDKRDIDLIIAPEYSAGDMFETLTLARNYAAEVKKPFPEIDDEILEDKDWPKDCYVFEGKDKEPTIVFMPLFNRGNCKDAQEYKAKMEEYSTFQRPFSLEKIKFLLETAKANMENNKEILLREMNKAALRRQNKNQG